MAASVLYAMYHRGMALVEVDAVSKSYPRRAGLRTEMQTVVEDVSLTIEAGETLGLVGESGSGKTTLARMILGLVAPSRWQRSAWTARMWRELRRAEMRRLRRQMQPVFQDPYAALNPRMKVLEIVTEPLVIHRRRGGNRDGPRGAAGEGDRVAGEVGLDESALGRYPHEFSGRPAAAHQHCPRAGAAGRGC